MLGAQGVRSSRAQCWARHPSPCARCTGCHGLTALHLPLDGGCRGRGFSASEPPQCVLQSRSSGGVCRVKGEQPGRPTVQAFSPTIACVLRLCSVYENVLSHLILGA